MRKRPRATTEHTFTAVLEPQGAGGGFYAHCPALRGCQTQGDSYEEAVVNLRDAMRLYCESLSTAGEPIPAEELIVKVMKVRA